MKKSVLILFSLCIVAFARSQNVGVGTTSPTNTLHVTPAGGADPLRVDGLNQYNTERHLFVVDPLTGVVKHMHVDSLPSVMSTSFGTDDQNLDSLTLNGNILTAYIENGASANIDLSPLLTGATDDQNIDSLTLIGTILTVYIENGASANIDLASLQDGTGTDDQNIDSLTLNGTVLTTYIENGTSANINLNVMLDSVVFSKSDSLYSIISDSLLNDTAWLNQIGDSLDTDVDSVVLVGDTAIHIYEDGKNIIGDISALKDSAEWIDGDIVGLTKNSILARKALKSNDTVFIDTNGDLALGTTLTPRKLNVIDNKDATTGVYIANSFNTSNAATGVLLSNGVTNGYFHLFAPNYTLSPGVTDQLVIRAFNNVSNGIKLWANADISMNTGGATSGFTRMIVKQNGDVGIGTTTTTNRLHVSSGSDPMRIEGLQYGGVVDSIMVSDGTGVLKLLRIDSLINRITDSVNSDDQQVDNFSLSGTTLTLEIESDGQPAHTVNLASLQDGTGTDDQNIDSLRLNGTVLTTYIENGASALVNLQPLVDSAIANSTGTDDQQVDNFSLSGTTLTLEIESDGQPAHTVNLASLQDGTGTDDQNIDSLRLNGTILTTYIENGASALVDLQPLVDSAIANSSGGDNDWDVNGTGLEGNPGTNIASGLNSIAAGDGNVASGNYAVAFGRNDTATVTYAGVLSGNGNAATAIAAVVSGGLNNKASTQYSNISGGQYNVASGINSVVGGGERDTAFTTGATVGGGTRNLAGAITSTVSGGDRNKARSTNSTISGGSMNEVIGIAGVVSGGTSNVAGAQYSGVSGGFANTASAQYSAVAGGRNNIASGLESFVGGGDRDTASGQNTVVAGGLQNKAFGLETFVGAGRNNKANGSQSFIGGGNGNTTTTAGNASVIVGGAGNVTSQIYATIVGGAGNIASGSSSFIGAGSANHASGFLSVIGGGSENLTSGDYSTVAGGIYDTASGFQSFIGGGANNKATGQYSFVGGGVSNTASQSHAIVVGGFDNIASGAQSIIVGGGQNFTSGSYSTILGGLNDTALGLYSTVLGSYNKAQTHGEFVGGAFSTPYTTGSGALVWSGNDRAFTFGTGSFGSRADGLVIHKDGNVFIGSDWSGAGGTGTRMTSGAGVMFLNRGTAPGSLTGSNKTAIWNNAGEIQVKDESNNVTTISPHNFSLIPGGASEELAWAFYSERDGKVINVDMAKLARLVEELSGENLVYILNESTQEVEVKELNQSTSHQELLDKVEEQNQVIETQNEKIKSLENKIEKILESLNN